MRRAVVVAIFALAAGLALATVVVTVRTAAFAADAESADGRVVAVDVRQSGGAASEVAYFPVVEFTPAGARRPVRFAGDGSGATEYRVGDTAPVLYPADDPAEARIGGLAGIWGVPAGLAFAAMLTAGCGVLARRILLEEPPGGPDPEEDPP
jgi:hypothetical protein